MRPGQCLLSIYETRCSKHSFTVHVPITLARQIKHQPVRLVSAIRLARESQKMPNLLPSAGCATGSTCTRRPHKYRPHCFRRKYPSYMPSTIPHMPSTIPPLRYHLPQHHLRNCTKNLCTKNLRGPYKRQTVLTPGSRGPPTNGGLR
jgi:hypothetical protein